MAHQTADRIGVPNKARNIAVFDNLIVRKNHVDFDGVRYPRAGSIGYASIDYVYQYRDLETFYKEYVGKELPKLFIIYTDMKNKHLFKVIDLRFHFDQINLKKINFLKNIQMLLKC